MNDGLHIKPISNRGCSSVHNHQLWYYEDTVHNSSADYLVVITSRTSTLAVHIRHDVRICLDGSQLGIIKQVRKTRTPQANLTRITCNSL